MKLLWPLCYEKFQVCGTLPLCDLSLMLLGTVHVISASVLYVCVCTVSHFIGLCIYVFSSSACCASQRQGQACFPVTVLHVQVAGCRA